MNVTIIVAKASNGVIGDQGKLPWKISADLKFFKQKTLGSAVILGRKTWDSLGHRALPGRLNIVVSTTICVSSQQDVRVVRSLKHAFEVASAEFSQVFIIGGAVLYQAALQLPSVKTAWITEIHAAYPGDVFFPALDETWTEVSRQAGQDTRFMYAFDFVKYCRD